MGSCRSRVEPLAQGLALDVGHDVVHQAVHLVGVVQRKDVRVVQPGGDLDLVQETAGADLLGQVGTQYLDRDVAVVLEVVGEEDPRHPALAQLALEAVPGRERRAEALDQPSHDRPPQPDLGPVRSGGSQESWPEPRCRWDTAAPVDSRKIAGFPPI